MKTTRWRWLRFLLIPLIFVPGSSRAQVSEASPTADTFSKQGHIYVGVDYYPEHWPRSRWETDVRLIREAGFNVVRLAEFSWVWLEPAEGQFDFSWLDEIIALLRRHDIDVILGTPTAVMPAWLARKYPETLAMQRDGERMVWGSRKDYSLSSETYRSFSRRITRAMAEHFASTPNVIGWQTDNEFSGPQDFSETSRADFEDWLRGEYQTLDRLNAAWGNHFWGHILQDWAEITIPHCEGEGMWGIRGNPSACLDWRRFNSWLNVRFQHDQVAILREVTPDRFITHNLMGLNPTISYYDLTRDLDFVSWDNYPVLNQARQPYAAAMAADLMRGIKQKNFWIMEQTAGPLGWGYFTRAPRPGELRSICYQQLARGADAQIWFRWRTATAGREQYWHGLLGHDGKPGRRYEEAARVADEYRRLEKLLEGTTVRSDVAIIYDYESIWSLDNQPGFRENNYIERVARYYDAFFRAGINVDLISPEADLSSYRLVLAPDLVIMPDPRARKLIDYVDRGGVLLVDARTGVKDEHNLAHERTLPGLLGPVLGIEINEYEAIEADSSYHVLGDERFPDTLSAVHYVDWVVPLGAEVLARHDRWHMSAFAAVTTNRYGNGKAWYVGTIFKEQQFYDDLVARLLADAGIRTVLDLPAGVEASIRQGNGKTLLFLINHGESRKSVMIPAGKTELISNTRLGDRVDLDFYGVAVIAW